MFIAAQIWAEINEINEATRKQTTGDNDGDNNNENDSVSNNDDNNGMECDDLKGTQGVISPSPSEPPTKVILPLGKEIRSLVSASCDHSSLLSHWADFPKFLCKTHGLDK